MLRYLAKRGLRKGIKEGSSLWLRIGLVATFLRLIRRLTRRKSQTIFRTAIHPGQTYVVRQSMKGES